MLILIIISICNLKIPISSIIQSLEGTIIGLAIGGAAIKPSLGNASITRSFGCSQSPSLT